MNFPEALQDLTTQFEALGVRATYNPKNVNPPCIWVTPGVMEYDILDADTYFMTFDVYLIDSNGDPLTSMTVLSEMLEKIRIPFGVQQAEPIMVTLPTGGQCTALFIQLQTQITKD